MDINNTQELQLRISQIEGDLDLQEEALRLRLQGAYKQLQPLNLIRNTLKNAVKVPEVTGGLVDLAAGLGAGIVTKKLISGKSSSMIRKIAGTAAEMLVTNFVAGHLPDFKTRIRSSLQKLKFKQTD